MSTVKIKDKEFSIFIPETQILEAIQRLANKINEEMEGKNPLFVGILNGSFMFAGDLMKCIKTNCEISFIKVASYSGTSSSGEVKQLIGFNDSIKGRNVVILEDIVDTGVTLENIINQLKEHEPADVRLATLLYKPAAFRKTFKIDYVAMEIPNDFIVGYGLDYDGYGRNLRDIYKIVE